MNHGTAAISGIAKRAALSAFPALVTLAGCSTNYVVPPGPMPISSLTESSIAERMSCSPDAQWPATLCAVRVQAAEWTSYNSSGYGVGRYSVVTGASKEVGAALEAVASWPCVRAVTPVSRLLLPPTLQSDLELRQAAASLHADILLVYTCDTRIHNEGNVFGPLAVVTLGAFPSEETRVESTASGVLFDVRTGFVYGLGESSATAEQLSNAWTNSQAVDQARRRAEDRALLALVGELKETWTGVLAGDARGGCGAAPAAGAIAD